MEWYLVPLFKIWLKNPYRKYVFIYNRKKNGKQFIFVGLNEFFCVFKNKICLISVNEDIPAPTDS